MQRVPKALLHVVPLSPSLPTKPSSHAVGLAFERASLAFLSGPPLALSLLHVGQSNDRGVDLRGWWNAPTSSSSTGPRKRWGVLVQCKAERLKLGARVVRELEGVVAIEGDAQGARRGNGGGRRRVTVGMVVSQSGFSSEALTRAAASELPLSLVHLCSEGPDRREGEAVPAGAKYECRAFVVNTPLRELLGPSLEVEIKRSLDSGRTEIAFKSWEADS